MRLPIDTSRLQFLVVAAAEPMKKYEDGKPRESWAPRTDENGEVLWRVQMVALGDGEAEIIKVAVPGDPNVSQGEMVRVEAMTARRGRWKAGRAWPSAPRRCARRACGRRRPRPDVCLGVRRGAITAEDTLGLAAGAVAALWRWRVELAAVAAPLVAVNVIAPELGEAGAKLVVAAVVLVVVAVPVSRRGLVRLLGRARLRRRWRRAWVDCGLPRVRAGRLVGVPAGELLRVRVARGSSLDAVAGRAEQLAACLRLREVRVCRDADDAACGTLTLVRRDPLAGRLEVAWPHRDAASLSLWGPIPLGVDELGGTVRVSLPERNVLLGGEPGAGKSAALSMLVATAALDPTAKLWLLDGKLVELSAWAPCAERLAGPDVEEAIDLLRMLRGEMDERYRVLLAAGRRKVGVGDGLPLHLVACDELAFYLTVEDRKKQREFAELLRDVVARGRAAGVIVCAATQKPAADVVPSALRDLFGFRLALRCNTPQASDTILGQGWATLGHNAAAITPGQRGVGVLLAEDGIPVRLRGFYLGDREVDELARRASELRNGNE